MQVGNGNIGFVAIRFSLWKKIFSRAEYLLCFLKNFSWGYVLLWETHRFPCSIQPSLSPKNSGIFSFINNTKSSREFLHRISLIFMNVSISPEYYNVLFLLSDRIFDFSDYINNYTLTPKFLFIYVDLRH